MTEYYRQGELDDCFGKWSDFYQCVTSGTKLADKVRLSRQICSLIALA